MTEFIHIACVLLYHICERVRKKAQLERATTKQRHRYGYQGYAYH